MVIDDTTFPTLSVGVDSKTPFVCYSTSSAGVVTQYVVYTECMPNHNITTIRAATITGGSGYHYTCSIVSYPGGTCQVRCTDGALGDGSLSVQAAETMSQLIKYTFA